MKVTLAIKPHQDGTDICFGKLQIHHVECENGKVSIHRNPASGEYSLCCDKCDIRIHIADHGTGCEKIIRTSIDEENRSLTESDFDSDSVHEIQITSSNH